LKDFDPDFHEGLGKEETQQETTKLCMRVGELQQRLFANASHAVLIILQGMDTSGKDGTTRRLLEFVNPAGVQVTYFKVPTLENWRTISCGEFTKPSRDAGILGSSTVLTMKDVLVVRVLNLQPRKVWESRFEQINAFEKVLVKNKISR